MCPNFWLPVYLITDKTSTQNEHNTSSKAATKHRREQLWLQRDKKKAPNDSRFASTYPFQDTNESKGFLQWSQVERKSRHCALETQSNSLNILKTNRPPNTGLSPCSNFKHCLFVPLRQTCSIYRPLLACVCVCARVRVCRSHLPSYTTELADVPEHPPLTPGNNEEQLCMT